MSEIRSIATEGPTPDEMQKLQNQLINDAVRTRQSAMSRAQQLAEFMLYDGDPNLINTELEELLAITPDQIRAAASEFLDTANRALLDVVPAGKG
jgi:zinc protease